VGLGPSLRFAIEAALLIVIGVALAAADLGLLPFVLFMAGAWVLVATAERMLSRPDVAAPFSWRRSPEELPESLPLHRPRAPEPQSFEPATEPPSEPQSVLEAVPQPTRRPEPEPDPEPDPEPRVEEAEEEASEPPPDLPRAAHRSPNGWNLWDLELRAKQLVGEDPARDEEWNALFVSLRDYAQPDGTLPAEFDALVHESFGALISRRP
jgi:hypothetical protein